jgi:acetolactate synthase-1/2/3 large subunit
VNVDYSRKSEVTKGIVKVNLGRFPFDQKLRFIGRAVKRHGWVRWEDPPG